MISDKARLDHVSAIKKYIETITDAEDMHSLIIEGPPGWGKTTSVEESLLLAKVEALHLGAYSTPLNLYNFLAENSDGIILLDDCAGIFNDPNAMAILKAATWPSRGNRRLVKWGSTSTKATVDQFEFFGKLIIVCNSFPKTADGEAIRSRGYSRRIDITLSEAKKLLLQAASMKKWFSKTKLSSEVAEFLVGQVSESSLSQISFRTLKKGYRLAEVHPESWRELFADTLPKGAIDPSQLIKELSRQNLMVKEQKRIFIEKTGLSSRSFFNYRKNDRVSKSVAKSR
jgi:DNA polymerase III delta prime subunit